jgi:ornithine cyclodeaminase/alanine dehydrogenase-like protein (mu-crystallin family)
MPDVILLGAADLRRVLDTPSLVDALQDGFRRLSAREVSSPPRTAAVAGGGLILAMLAGVGSEALGAKLVTSFSGNAGRGLPVIHGLVVLFDADTGRPEALVDGATITTLRTAAVSALSARLLAGPPPSTLAIVGAGVQSAAHIDAMATLFTLDDIRVTSRNSDHAAAVAARHPAARVAGLRDAVEGADVVCCCTGSDVPVIERGWLRDGAHVVSVGFGDGQGELDRETISAGALFVESRVAFEPAPAGARELQGLDPAGAAELGEVLAGVRPGRIAAEQITVFKSVGHAMEDVIAARLAMQRACAAGIGTEVAW